MLLFKIFFPTWSVIRSFLKKYDHLPEHKTNLKIFSKTFRGDARKKIGRRGAKNRVGVVPDLNTK